MIEQRVLELKRIIETNDGRNAADARFAQAVDELLDAFYDDIGEIKHLPLRAVFDLFVIKVLYVARGSRHADIIDYLGQLLESYLYTRALYPPRADGRGSSLYFSDVLDEERRAELFHSRFEAYRSYADSALFMSGVLPRSVRPLRRQRGTMRSARRRGVDRSYYVSTGKTMYRMAAGQTDAEAPQRETLSRLALGFEFYADALSEMSERYLTGFDTDRIADRMLDNFNRYRTSQEPAYLEDARRYAALLRLDPERFPALFDSDEAHRDHSIG